MIVLKIILLILLSVILLIFFALLIPARICTEYKKEPKVTVKYLFFTIPLVPQKKKKKNEPKKNQEKKKPEDKKKKKEDSEAVKYIKSLYNDKGLDGILSMITELAKLASGSLKGLFKHILFKKFDLNITVAADDAAAAAIRYGQVCAAAYPAVSLILNTVRYKDYNVNITVDFDLKEPVIDFKTQANIIPIFAVTEAVKLLLGFVKLKKSGVM